jgi:integrase
LPELQVPATVKARSRVLSRDEVAALLPVLRASAKSHATLIRLLLLTLTRLNEAAGARWRDIDLDAGTWTIHETKNGQPLVVPLSRQARGLLDELKPKEVHPESLVFATAVDTAPGTWDRETKALAPCDTCFGH